MPVTDDMHAEDVPRPLVSERDRIIEHLQEGYARDLLSVEEFERRLDAVHDCTNATDLAVLVRDLPAPVERTPEPEPAVPVKERATIVAALGGADRRGAWRPARHTRVVAVMGGVDLDFSEVRLPPGVTEVSVFCVMGGVDIIVPPGVNVEVAGIPIMGGFDDRAGSDGGPDAPTLRVHGAAIMGGVDVKRPKKRKRKHKQLD